MTTGENPTVLEYVADSTTAPRLASAWARYSFTRPRYIALYVLVVLVVVAYGFFAANPASIAIYVVVIVLVLGFLLFRTRSRIRKSFTRLYPVGTTISVGVGDRALFLRGATSESTVEYKTYSEVIVRDTAVILRMHSSNVSTVLPREVLPGSTAELLRTRVVAAGQPGFPRA
jgi:hypothetical protein